MSCQDPAAVETLPYSAHLDNEQGVELIFLFLFCSVFVFIIVTAVGVSACIYIRSTVLLKHKPM